MRVRAFSSRVTKEILRDPLTLGFGLGFPVVLIVLLSAIQANIPVDLFEIERLAPGMVVFGLAFISLFAATLIARDRESAFLQRLFATPMTPADFIIGYALPFIPMAAAQSAVCYCVAFIIGLTPSVNVLYSVLSVIPLSLFFIFFGLMCGSVLSVKQVGGICGALFTNLTAWLSGIWFDLDLVGGAFKKAAEILPFYHAVNTERSIIAGVTTGMGTDIAVTAVYTAAAAVAAILLFLRQMKKH